VAVALHFRAICKKNDFQKRQTQPELRVSVGEVCATGRMSFWS